MQSVRQQTPPIDFSAACTVTEDNAAYPFPGIGNTFPRLETAVPNVSFRRLKPLQLGRELALQVARLNHHADNIVAALDGLARINYCLSRQEVEEANSLIAAHKSTHGLSLVLVKKELLLALETHGLAGLSRRYKALTNGCDSTAWALLCHYFYDIVDVSYDPVLAVLGWLNITATRMEPSEWYARLIEEDILTRSPTEASLASAFLRFSAVSLLDLTLLLWQKATAHPDNTTLQNAFDRLDRSLRQILVDRFSELIVSIPKAYRLSDRPPSDIDVYRTSFFFNEIKSVAAWRCHISTLIFPDKFRISSLEHDEISVELDRTAAAIAAKPERCAIEIAHLATWEKNFLQAGSDFADQKFLTAAVVSESLRKIARGALSDAQSIAQLLASTDDIHLYVSIESLRELLAGELAHDSPLLCFVLQEIIYRRSRTQDNELERRLAFMKLFDGKTGAAITELLDTLSVTSLETAILLGRTCTRTFLERLYLMMTSVKDVLETRLGICRWLKQHTGRAGTLDEECEALERELANLDARSDIDSTRVHVDEESLREWFYTTQLANTTRYVQTVLAEGATTDFGSLLTFFVSRGKAASDEEDLTADTQIGSEFLLSEIFNSTFKAFTSDRTFGLDAYLSRRIRHGSLSGHVITPITRVLNRLSEVADANESIDVSGIKSLVQEWRPFLVNELDHVRREIIQINSPSHPEGLIQATWHKTAGNIAHLDAMIARARSRVIETGGDYDIFADLYPLCWDCLESSLAQLRRYMVRQFLPRATNRLDALVEKLSDDERMLAFSAIQDFHVTLGARLQEVCGWFIRPVFRRDRYDLHMLTTSVLSIVREHDEHCSFTEDVSISDQISLNRGSFDVFGDALFVLIGNAARHGKSGGQIAVSASPVEGRSNLVLVNVTSEMPSVERHREAVSRIRSALLVKGQRAIERAAVEEGFSGLRKLAGVLQRVRSPDVAFAVEAPEQDMRITFWLTLPAEITFGARSN